MRVVEMKDVAKIRILNDLISKKYLYMNNLELLCL